MSDYIVSARKYRPQTFDTVVGQEHITTTLKNAIKNQHLAHAYLFCGPRGVGKTTCARILAKTINCESPTADMEACGMCNTCVSFKNNTSFNVFELDAASNNSVDDIRELTNQVRFQPQQGKYKVYIIDEVHMLSAAAFNAFLKTLEEPPPYAIFILATTEKHKILPTILSRCQIFDFKRITTHDIVAHLQSIATKESMVAQEAALHIISQKSEGCMRDALSMLDRIASFTNGMLTYTNTMEHLNLLDADFYFKLTDGMLSQDVAGTLLQLDKALEKGFEGDVIISGLAEHFRNLLLCKDARMAKLLDLPNDFRPVYNEKANQAPPSFILSALNVINDSELNYKTATNKRLHVEMCLIRLCFLLQSLKPSATFNSDVILSLSKDEDVKKNTHSVESPVPAPKEQPKTTSAKENKIIENQIVEEKSTVVIEQTIPPAPKTQEPIITALSPAPSTTLQPKGRRLSKDMLSDMDERMNREAGKETEQKELTEELANQLFEQYKQQLKAADKNVIYAQFCMMRIEVLPPDEVKLISPTELTDTYAREQRNQLLDFYRAETKINVRVTTDIQEDEATKNAPKTVVLSKSEVFDVMVQKNPSLGKLKDGLGMSIEY
ncbi:MAG: polymerase subunit gamma/tau [Flavipsychrobacter sp.]|jgi:DNA polymerase-3 subunit gamma/tau|nr:polymerase subunit gamma/tau [Flavipsychrobacter sp.]